MATIIEDALWTVEEKVADHMVEIGLLKKCDHEHIDILEADKPIYHISPDAPDWFGFATLPGTINNVASKMENI